MHWIVDQVSSKFIIPPPRIINMPLHSLPSLLKVFFIIVKLKRRKHVESDTIYLSSIFPSRYIKNIFLILLKN